MTEQIVVKLNKTKFRPLLNHLNLILKGSSQSDSWLAGFALWCINAMYFTKVESYLDGSTILQYLSRKKGWTEQEAPRKLVERFNEFLKHNKTGGQIVIKLNKKKFKPLLDNFKKVMPDYAKTYSWCTAFAFWYINQCYSQQRDWLEGRTIAEHILEQSGMSLSEALLYLIGSFTKFLRNSDYEF